MRLLNRISVLLLTCVMILLSGCNEKVYNQTENNAADVTQNINRALHKSDRDAKAAPSLLMKDSLYVDKTPISLMRDPSWLKNHIIVKGDDLPFSYYSRMIANGGGPNILTRYQVGLDSNMKLSINYSGTVKGALDLIAAKTGYVYAIRDRDVYWQSFITKTFPIAFMPGTSDYSMGKSSTSTTGAAPIGGGSNSTVSGFIDDSASSQYSNLKGTLSIWKDLDSTVRQLLSPEGKVLVSEATTSITVRDRPTNVELISQYIDNLNNNLSKQVLVKIQVLEVNLTSDFNFGINWDLIQRSLANTNFILKGDGATPISIVSLGTTTPLTMGLSPQNVDANGNPTGTVLSAIVTALKQQGKVSIVSEPRVVCLNNQVSAVRIVTQEGYLASLEVTSFGVSTGLNNGSVTSQITPGTIITGLTLYVLPKILGNKIYLQVNADLSNNQGFKNISSTAVATPSSSIIQVPTISQKQFNQRSVIASGDTLILSGFRKISNQTGAVQFFDSQALGGKSSTQGNAETIVLITPIILPGAGV